MCPLAFGSIQGTEMGCPGSAGSGVQNGSLMARRAQPSAFDGAGEQCADRSRVGLRDSALSERLGLRPAKSEQ